MERQLFFKINRQANETRALSRAAKFGPFAYGSSEAATPSPLTSEQDLASSGLQDLQQTFLLQLTQEQSMHTPISLPQTDIKIHHIPRLKRLAIPMAQR